jgi:hypothetical protein
MMMKMMVSQLMLTQQKYQEAKLKSPRKSLKTPRLLMLLELKWSRPKKL